MTSCPAVRELFKNRGAHEGHARTCVRCQSVLRLGFMRTLSSSPCADIEPLLAELVLGPLGPEAERTLRAHLEGCGSCLAVATDLDRNPVGAALIDLGMVAVEDFKDLRVVEPENYVRGDEIGRGGMGRILRARDRRLGRAVVIKELLDERQRERFEHEARLTARLQHPAIVNVHEAGRWPNGEPFYVMKYVAGRPLEHVIEDTRSLDERLALLPNLITVVEAVAYAHSVQVIHRDLKPANILVGEFGETVVIDWGLARDLGDTASEGHDAGPYRGEASAATCGAGTPQYMPPEQVTGHVPDARLDVFALGATLYHLLAGAAPYGEMPAFAVLELVRTAGPPPLAEVEPRVPRALQAVVAKAMARDPADRYATAGELAADLKRFQSGQLVAAHDYTVAERATRFLRKNRALVALAAASLATLSAVGAASVNNVIQAKRRTEAQLGQLLLERGQRELLAGAPSAALVYLDEALRRGVDTTELRFLVAEAARAVAQVASFAIPDRGLVAARFSPDGTRLATASSAGLRLWDVAAGRATATLAPGAPSTLLFSPDGARLLSGELCELGSVDTSSCDPGLRLWDPVAGRLVALLPHDAPVTSARFDGGSVVTVAGDQRYTWNAADGRLRDRQVGAGVPAAEPVAISDDGMSVTVRARRFDHGAAIAAIRLAGDGATLATVGVDGVVRLWDVGTGAARGSVDRQGGPLLDAAVDGGRLVTAGVDGVVRVVRTDRSAVQLAAQGGHMDWEPAALRAAPTVAGAHRALSDDGTRIVGYTEDSMAAVWDAATGARLAEVPVELAPTLARADLVLAPGGDRLAALAGDRRVQVWSLGARARLGTIAASGPITQVAWSPDGARLLVVAAEAEIWTPDGRLLGTMRAPVGLLTTAAFSPDGERVLAGARTGVAELFDAATGELLATLGPLGAPVDNVAFDPSGARAYVAAGSARGLWDVTAERHDAVELDALVAALPLRFDGVAVVPRAAPVDRPEAPNLVRARVHLAAGNQLLQARRFGEAEKEFEAAYHELPWPGYGRLAELARLGRPGHAVDISLDRMHERFEVARQHYERREYAAAAAEFLLGYGYAPRAGLLFNAAVCYERQRDYREAAALFTTYLELQPFGRDRADVEQRIAALRRAR
jgi:WD40 repeat protein/tRNA A-37 threonylcarbamoyl transferase component Bud32